MTKSEQLDGPELPLKLRGHCLVNVNEDSILLTGGMTLGYKKYIKLINSCQYIMNKSIFSDCLDGLSKNGHGTFQ